MINIDKLMQQLAAEEETCRKASGTPVVYSEGGPASLALVKSLIQAIVEQQVEIEALNMRGSM